MYIYIYKQIYATPAAPAHSTTIFVVDAPVTLQVRHHRCSLPCTWALVYGMFVMNLGLQFCISMFAVGFAVGRFRSLLASSLCSTRWSQQQPLGPFATVRTCPPCQPSSHGWQGGMDKGSYGTLWAQPLGGLTPQTRR